MFTSFSLSHTQLTLFRWVKHGLNGHLTHTQRERERKRNKQKHTYTQSNNITMSHSVLLFN